MQCNFTFYRFVSSSLFYLELVVKLFDYFWKPSSLFSKFCVNCLLMFYFVYCNNFALKDVNGSCYSTCSLVALSVPEMCFWPAETRWNLELFEIHTCHWPGAQIWSIHTRRKLATASLLRPCIDWYGCVRYWNEFFSAVFQILDWSFLVLHFDGNVCNWIPKVIWSRMNWFWVFLLEMASCNDLISVWTDICKNCSIVILYWRHQVFSVFSLRGILVCSSKKLLILARRVRNIDW